MTDDRWAHIVEEHPEMTDLKEAVLETVAKPERLLKGKQGEMIAVRSVEEGKWVVAIYREMSDDGFVITAFLTRRANWLARRAQVWP